MRCYRDRHLRAPRSELFEFELDELFDEEFEFELLDELELEFDELLDDEFELELLDELELELEELLPATMIELSLRLLIAAGGRSTSVAAGYSLACAAVLARAAIPATSTDLNFQCSIMAFYSFSDGPAVAVRRSNGR